MRDFNTLSQKEILALAISLEEEDERIYADFGEKLRDNFSATAKIFDEMRLEDAWPRGVLPALERWLGTEEGSAFTVRRDLERYGMSCHPRGFLQRIAEART